MDDDEDAFVPPSFLSNGSSSSPAEYADCGHGSQTKLTLASSSSDEDDGGGGRGSNDSPMLHFDDDGMDSPEAAVLPPTPAMGRMAIDKKRRRSKKNKKRRNTTLFVPPPALAADALAEEEDCEEAKNDEFVAQPNPTPIGKEKCKESPATSDAKESNTDEHVDYQKMCKTYKDEHASLRFLIGILKLEKSDAESRLGQLSEAFETKSAQNKTMATELTKLRGENAALKQAAADKQQQMDAMVTSLQAQMMQGLSAAVEKTKKLQAELEKVTAEKEQMQEELEELRAEND